MHIFLDTNVVLTGAFAQNGPSTMLGSIKSKVQFCHSKYVIHECGNLINKYSPTEEIFEFASLRVKEFLIEINSECVPEHPLPSGIFSCDPDDDPILGAAIGCGAKAICTYNIKDFPSNHIGITTPLALLRSISEPMIDQYIQPILLSSKGTLLFFGRIQHTSSMGLILESENKIAVTTDALGYIKLTGPNTPPYKSFHPLVANKEFKLSIRYNHTCFEAAIWTKTATAWVKTLLTTGVANFSNTTTSILFFSPNHHFSGHIQCISGLPRYIRDKQLFIALENYSLEAVTKSLDIRSLLKSLVIKPV